MQIIHAKDSRNMNQSMQRDALATCFEVCDRRASHSRCNSKFFLGNVSPQPFTVDMQTNLYV